MATSQVEEIKQKADIVSLIDGRVKLSKAGRNFRALCPFHGEKTPSFFVSPEMQTFKCFGCDRGGDVFSFLQEFEGMTFPEALEYLARQTGVKLQREYRSGEEQKRERLLQVLHLAEEYYAYLLTKHRVGKKALAYLKKRGIGNRLIQTFGLGYAPESWDGLQRYLVGKKKYLPEELEAVGMVLKSTKGRTQGSKPHYYDRFRGRILFPLRDMRGKVLGFSGRVMPGADEQEGGKYVNTPETSLYHKRSLLYGLSEVRSEIKKKDQVVLVEGELDMISSYRAGVKQVVAIKGSAVTEEQVALLRRLTQNMVLALDADAAGSEATKRGVAVADKLGMNLSVVEVVGGKDPDDLVQVNPAAWRELVKKSEAVYDYLIRQAFKTHDVATGEGKRKISRELAPVLAGMSNQVEQEHYMGVVAEKLGVGEQSVRQEVLKAEKLPGYSQKDERRGTGEEQQGQKKEMSRREKLERHLVAVFLQFDGGLQELYARVDLADVADAGVRRLWKAMGQVLEKKHSVEIRQLVELLPLEQQRLVEELFTEDVVALPTDEDKLRRVFLAGLEDLQQLRIRDELIVVGEEIAQLEDKGKLTDAEKIELKELEERFRELTGGLQK